MPYLTPNLPTDNVWVVRRIRTPRHLDFMSIMGGALNELCNYWNFEQSGDMTPQETAMMFLEIQQDWLMSTGFMIGQITPYMTENPPTYCLPCDGGTYNRTDWPELYALLDAAFILDADTFTTPNLNNGSVPLGAGISAESTVFAVGQTGGTETVALTGSQNGEHTHSDLGHVHTYQPPGATGLAVAPGELPVLLPALVPSFTGTGNANLDTSGTGEPHNNIPPYVALKYCVVAR